ncbi:MAG: flagellar hook-basal body complex protein FliE [Mesorhizobium sp.]
MIGGIGGIGALQLKPEIGGTDAATNLFQGGGAPLAGTDIGTTFAEALSHAASKTVGTLQNAEQVSLQALKGDADTRQVVDAVMSAQQALQTAVAIRDKVVSAYLEVSRMGI